MSERYEVEVVSADEYGAWRDSFKLVSEPMRAAHDYAQEYGKVKGAWGPNAFHWTCPGCGQPYSAVIGDNPVSGWENPRWVNSGTEDKPTLTPSLGCSLWRSGQCYGHWWLRGGWLERA